MTLEEIKKTIETAVPEATVYIFDPLNDGQHLQAVVISSRFGGMPLVKQHQLVMKALQEALSGAVHALGLKTFTPEKWDQAKGQYGL